MEAQRAAIVLDDAGVNPRAVADQVVERSRPAMTLDVYMGWKVANPAGATALENALPATGRDHPPVN